MHFRRLAVLAFSSLALLLASRVPAHAAPPGDRPAQPKQHAHIKVCEDVPAGEARCHAHRRTDAVGAPSPHAVASRDVVGNGGAYDPSFLQSAYNVANLAATNGGNQTVAIVDAYNDPRAASDLNYYRSFFGLPACTSANGCFKKVNQYGQTYNFPTGNTGWAQEISLDLDMVSAICPRCHILLVEARSNNFSDLAAAVDTAARLGAKAISNSYGGGEYSGEVYDQSHFNHPGVAITASSGDGGYGVEFPAASQYVTAVGGTSLLQDTSDRGWSEAVWSGAGSGCSAYIAKPSWQSDTGCDNRTVADVSAVADPNTGVWVYDTYGTSGWYIFGGTSAASPIVASIYALADNAAAVSYGSSSYDPSAAASLNDVTSGSNGSCGSYLCTGGAGYDGPTGNGTPNGTGGF